MSSSLKRKFTFEQVVKRLTELCNEFGRIPSYSEIIKDKLLPHPKTIQEYIEENGLNYAGYIGLCESMGFKNQKRKSKFSHIKTFEDVCALWDKYFEEHDIYPDGSIVRKRNHLPPMEFVKEICGERYHEFRAKYKLKIIPDIKLYDEYCEIFIEESNKKGQPLSYKDLDTYNEYSHILPSARWFINNCPDKNVKDYNSFLEYLGFKPRYSISKEFATEFIINKYNKLKRNLIANDFKLHDHDKEVGIQTIKNHWGSFNNMLKELGLPLNWESYGNERAIEQLKDDINKLCEFIFLREGRRLISYDDIDNCDWCYNNYIYNRRFKKELGMSLAEYIKSIGFDANQNGKGMRYKFDDGEKTLSKWEYLVSKYLRDKGLVFNVDYKRDVYYKTFINGYKGNKNIDYVVFNKWYIEIAGIILSKEDYSDKRKSILNYKKNLAEKENMLKANNLNYKIIYPEDLQRPLDEVFSFLWEDESLRMV